ncbi:hypothetical protein M0657_012312 [Pyricularia oryzae]|nr:hypothetical protein M0657_012312 [Pyricularia oryzae]
MKTSVILTLVTLLSAAVALPAITTNTESVHVVQGENEIGTPKMHRRSSTSTNKDITLRTPCSAPPPVRHPENLTTKCLLL